MTRANRVRGRPQTDKSGIPQQLVFWAIGIGLFLTLGGSLSTGYVLIKLGGPQSVLLLASLITCVGLGLVLVAFGSRASGNFGKWSATGAGAMAVGLFVAFQQFLQPSASDFQKKGQIDGDFTLVADIEIRDAEPLYIRREKRGVLHFVVLERHFRSGWIDVWVDTTEKGKEAFKISGRAEEIQKYLVDPHKVIKWTFDYQNRKIKDEGKVLFEERELREKIIVNRTVQQHTPNLLAWLRFVGPAFAGRESFDISTLIEGLKSEETAIRRKARDALAAKGAEAVGPLMAALRADIGIYRMRVGVAYILSEMIQQKIDLGSIRKNLNQEDINLLVNLAAFDLDSTVRLEATEFLYSLGDKRVIQPSIEATRKKPAEKGLYNAVLIVKPSFSELSDVEKQRVSEELRKSVPATSLQTIELIDSLSKKK